LNVFEQHWCGWRKILSTIRITNQVSYFQVKSGSTAISQGKMHYTNWTLEVA